MFEFHDTILSVFLGNERLIWVKPPRSPFCPRLVMFLDGELYRERAHTPEIVASLAGANKIADAWFVYVSMHSVERRWIECPCYEPFARFLGEEVLAWLVDRFPLSAHATARTIVGLSYTGLAAAYISQVQPGIFQHVIAQSGSFWWNDFWLPREFEAHGVPANTAYYLEVGGRETQRQVKHREDLLQVHSQIEGVVRLREVLRQRGAPVVYMEFDGGHEFRFWARSLPRALQWALPLAERDLRINVGNGHRDGGR